MGLDFIRRAAPSFAKSWNRNKDMLAEPTLFTRYPECRTRTAIADLAQNADLSEGENIIVCAKDSKLILVSGNTQVGIIEQPPSDLKSAIHNEGDCVLGYVRRINPLSGTADVEIG
ncbi:MAG: hypothetical protein OXC41_00365 [Gammaproteobacteria bacterium]|nr:hypothetical protein [Gammaproteobacteria bacterium]